MASNSGKKQMNRGSTNAQSASQPTQQTADITAPLFTQEISEIMRGYGDCESPLTESVILMEKIVVQQMRSLLHDLIDIAYQRTGKPHPAQVDVEFLMRKQPTKIHRMRSHLKFFEQRLRYTDLMNGRPVVNSEEQDISDDDVEQISIKHDDEKMRRLFRADRISLTLNGIHYAKYIQAKRTTFHARKLAPMRNKLKIFLSPPPDVQLSDRMYAILAYFMSETIATVVDYAILTRLNASNREVDPFQRVSSGKLNFILFQQQILSLK